MPPSYPYDLDVSRLNGYRGGGLTIEDDASLPIGILRMESPGCASAHPETSRLLRATFANITKGFRL